MRRIVWSDEAVGNLETIRAYVSDFSPLAAQRLALRLKATAEGLQEYAERGRLVRGPLRELTVSYPYIIRYRIEDDAVVILHIRHGARLQD